MSNQVTYVIVVHGVGEQRKYETILPVINGFAAIRQYDQNPEKFTLKGCSPLTQGMLSSHEGATPWVEFADIPASPKGKCIHHFIGRSVDHDESKGKNLRFVDMYWADIMQHHFKDAGQSVGSWTQSIIDRLELHLLDNPDKKWIPALISSMRKGILPIKHLMSFKHRILSGTSSHLDDMIFNRFLGDAQLYGEHAPTREQAVYRFHETMAKVHQVHLKEQERTKHKEKSKQIGDPRYMIMAHSLGSIMSFDALVYAHGKKTIGSRGHKVLDLEQMHLPHYKPLKNLRRRQPRMDWLDHVESFITMGSPIDKYLTLWWMNYEHLEEPFGKGLENIAHDPKIEHFNYCDEFDPVGHKLDTVEQTKIYNKLFNTVEDQVFMRYAGPKAHTQYWKDRPLLKHILTHAIDKGNTSELNGCACKGDGLWYSNGKYLKALKNSYYKIPSVGLLIMLLIGLMLFVIGGILNALSVGNNYGVYVKYFYLFIASPLVLAFTIHFSNLVIQWRQMGRCSKLSKKPKDANEQDKKPIGRKIIEYVFQYGLFLAPFVWIALLSLVIKPEDFSSLSAIKENIEKNWGWVYVIGISLLFGGLSLSISNAVWFVKMKRRYSDSTWLVWPLSIIFRSKKDANTSVYNLNFADYIKDSTCSNLANTESTKEEKNTKSKKVAEVA